MLILLFEYFFKLYFKFDIYSYVIVRALFSFLSSFLISLWIGPNLISCLKKLEIYEVIRHSGPKLHFIKQGTPTMGGIMIICSIIFSVLLWADLYNRYLWYVMFILLGYGIIGFFDDYYKVFKRSRRGLNISLKYFLLSTVGLLLTIVIFILERNILGTQLIIPWFKDVNFELGVWYIFLSYLMIVGISNAVNLSDGLDGLVTMPVVFISFGLGLVALITSNVSFSNYFHIQYFVYFRELVIVCAAIIGSVLGFLWFNTFPALIFMGDVGSLSLGGMLAVIAVLLHQEILLLIMGALFILETLSVIFQVYFFKMHGFRIFRMAPIHHHFELRGDPESRIVVRFWIITLVLVMISLVMLRYFSYYG